MSGEIEAAAEAAHGAGPKTRRGALLYALAAAVALVGLGDAIYLTVEHLAGRSVRCGISSGCSAVLASPYATLPGGVPLAAVGAAAYFTVFSLATLAAFGYTQARPLLAVLVALMLATTLWLLFVQAFVLHAFCDYCLLSAALTFALTTLVAVDIFSAKRSRGALP